jgi:hypothetical protein
VRNVIPAGVRNRFEMPPFDCTDLLAEKEVRSEDAEDEGDDRNEEIGRGHINSDQELDVWVIQERSWE